MKKGGDSGKAYHVKKERKRQKKRDKEMYEYLERALGLKGLSRAKTRRNDE